MSPAEYAGVLKSYDELVASVQTRAKALNA